MTEEEAPRRPLSWMQLLDECTTTLKASLHEPGPPEFWQHVRASRKESLLAVRSLIDAYIARLEEKDKQAQARKATKITVQ